MNIVLLFWPPLAELKQGEGIALNTGKEGPVAEAS